MHLAELPFKAMGPQPPVRHAQPRDVRLRAARRNSLLQQARQHARTSADLVSLPGWSLLDAHLGDLTEGEGPDPASRKPA